MNDETKLTDAQRAKLGTIPPKYRGGYVEAVTSNRRQLAIRAFCLECVGWNAAEVRRCTGRACPLFAYRMGGHPGASEPDAEAEPTGYPSALPVAESAQGVGIDAEPDPDPERRGRRGRRPTMAGEARGERLELAQVGAAPFDAALVPQARQPGADAERRDAGDGAPGELTRLPLQ